MAATPFSPAMLIICILNIAVVTALDKLLTISEVPFPKALKTSMPGLAGFSK